MIAMSDSLLPLLTKLRLSGLASSLEVRLHEAATSGLTHREFLELILQDEMLTREDRKVTRRIVAAAFRDQRRLEDFDFSFNPSIKKSAIYELATCRFVHQKQDVLFLGPPGTGKSHLAQSLGLAAIRCGFSVYYRSIFDVVRDFLHDEAIAGHERLLQKYLKPDLLIIDDMGMKQLPKRSGEYLFEIIMRRHELRSTMMTSNRPLEEWGKLIGDVPAATAILDRFLNRAELVQINGKSYRLEKSAKYSKGTKAPTGSNADKE
jgi:DNA replication protein DnaC